MDDWQTHVDESSDDTKPPRHGLSRGLSQLLQLPRALLSLVLVVSIRGYQIFISPLLGQNCRFTPTCSAYAIGAIRKHGPIRGGWAGIRRILRCHPWNPGGYDPP